MKLPYVQYNVAPSPLNPGGVVFEPRVPLLIIGPAGKTHWSALLDTGAAHCILPATEAAVLGIDLDGADQLTTAGFTGDALMVSLASVDFEITYAGETFRWPALVGFASFARPEDELVLLGHIGCLEYFRSIFDGNLHEVELLTTPSFPGNVPAASTP